MAGERQTGPERADAIPEKREPAHVLAQVLLDHGIGRPALWNDRTAKPYRAALAAAAPLLPGGGGGEAERLAEHMRVRASHTDGQTRQTWLEAAEVVVRSAQPDAERAPQTDEAGRRRYPRMLVGDEATAARHAEHARPEQPSPDSLGGRPPTESEKK